MNPLHHLKCNRSGMRLSHALLTGHRNLHRSLSVTSQPVMRCITSKANVPSQHFASTRNHLVATESQRQNQNTRIQGRAYTSSRGYSNTKTSSETPRDASFSLVIQQVVEILTESERDFLLALSGDELRLLERVGEYPSWWPVASFRSYNEVLLTLMGVKPCTLFCFLRSDCLPIFSRMVQTCFKPLFDTYQLESYGFILHQDEFGAYQLADTRSELWPLVQKVFMPLGRSYSYGGLAATPAWPLEITQYLIGKALGYPIPDSKSKLIGRVVYEDPREREKLAQIFGVDVPKVVAFDYLAGGELEDYQHSQKHFEQCLAAVQSQGGDLRYDTTEHEPFRQLEKDLRGT